LVKTPLLLPPSTNATVDDAAIGTIGSIPPLPLSTATAIAAVDNRHCRCHTVNDDDRQMPAVVDCCQQRQWRSLLMEATVNGGHGGGGLCQRRSSSTKVAMDWRDNNAMALATMASLANGGGGNGGCHRQLCSSG
jgi:hypothetical protein